MQKFYTGEKNIYTIFTHFAHFFANIFANIFAKFFAQIFTQNLHNFYTLLLSSRGLKSLCKFEKCKIFAKILHRGKKIFYTIFTHFAKKFAKIFAHIFTQFLHTILHKFCTFFTTAHFANFFAPQTTWRVRKKHNSKITLTKDFSRKRIKFHSIFSMENLWLNISEWTNY